jgi:hypothetical protein
MTILSVIAIWFGLSGAAALGWWRFHERAGPTPSIGSAATAGRAA